MLKQGQVLAKLGTTTFNNDLFNMTAAQLQDTGAQRNKILAKMKTCDKLTEMLGGNQPKLCKDLMESVTIVPPVKLGTQTPVHGHKNLLRSTVNKKINDSPASSKSTPFETIYFPYHAPDEEPFDVVKIENEAWFSQHNLTPHSSNLHNGSDRLSYDKSVPSVPSSTEKTTPNVLGTQYTYQRSKLKDTTGTLSPSCSVPKSILQDHMYSCSPAIKVQSLNAQTRSNREELQRRLEELRARWKHETLKIFRLQMHLTDLEKKMQENSREEIILPNSKPNLKQGRKLAGNRFSWLLREKEEYEKLLKDVREIKLKVLREKYNGELKKIRRLKMQMKNVGMKMKENNIEKNSISVTRRTRKVVKIVPEWMKREEEEYEQLLQDVTKMKQNYKLRKLKDNPVKSDATNALQSEKVLGNKECTVVATIPKKSQLVEEMGTGNRMMHGIEVSPHLRNDVNAYGESIEERYEDSCEIIGEIDEDSIDIEIDISNENMISNINEELPDPGLLDS